MNYKGIVLIILIAIALAAILYLPGGKSYRSVAAVGRPAPDFELKDSTGRLWRLSDLRGKVVFVNFWATWCTTCKAEMPYKERLYEKMQGRPFQMLGILYRDNPQNLIPYIQRYNVSPPTLIDDGDVARVYGITGVPETFIIDKEGIIRNKVVGPNEWDNPETIAMIEKLL
ncbi:MAG: TlpA disulfide reductase family protein [Thermodesulfovibrionia bacterium]